MKVKSLSHVRLFATPWTAAHQAPPSMGLSKQEYWSRVPLPSPHMVQVLENKKQNEASCFYLGKHVPESCPQKIRSCVLIRTSCYFSRCQVNVCLQEKSFRGACICSLGLLGQVLQTGVGGRTQQERVSSRELRQASEISSASPRSPPPHHLLQVLKNLLENTYAIYELLFFLSLR